MDLLKRNIGRRKFISMSSMAIGAGMLARPSGSLFAASAPSQAAAGAKSDGTKYGKYFTFAVNSEPTERGIQMFPMGGGGVTPEGFSGIIIGRMPPPGPMPSHDEPEKHDGEIEYLIHLGNNPDDPMDLGARADFYLGKGKWMEKHEITKSTAVYLPDGMWHCPWKVQKIDTEMTWVNVRIGEASMGGMPGGGEGGAPGGAPGGGEGGAPGGAPGGGAPAMESSEGLSAEELAKAKTSNFIFDKYLLSGVPKDMKDPKGGKWIAYTDCTKIAGGALTRIIRYNPDKAPYSIIDRQTHEYGSLFIFLGTDLKDCTNLGAEVELIIGPEKEKHTIDKTCYLYVPADTVHGPFKVTKASKPFNFLEIVAGPEMPGAVYG